MFFAGLEIEILFGIAVAIALVASVVITGLWWWLITKRRTELEAQASLIAGFVILLNDLKAEREVFVQRIESLEDIQDKCGKRVELLERLMNRYKIRIPRED